MIDPWIVVGIILLIAMALGYGSWVLYQKYVVNRPPGTGCHSANWKCNPTGPGMIEVFPDPSLKDPSSQQLLLANFAQVSGAGPALCLPMWYCFRYVNTKTGGYSPFSMWTQLPVYAGASVLPYPPGVNGSVGRASCPFNQPTIGIKRLDYPFSPNANGEFVVANVHRYTGKNFNDNKAPPIPTNENTEIVGYLSPYSDSRGNIKFAMVDIMLNPCKNGCGRCKGC